MGCGCKKNKTQEQPSQQPPSNIRLTEVQKPSTTQTNTQQPTQQTSTNSQ